MNIKILQLNQICDIDCIYCTRPEHTKNLNYLEIIKKIDNMCFKNDDKLIITGGEPTLITELPSIIKYAKQKGAKNILLQTNGYGFYNKKFTQDIYNSGLDSISFALPSHKKNIFELLTQSKNTIERRIIALKNISKTKIKTIINIVITNKNYKELLGFVKFTKYIHPNILKFQFSFIDYYNDKIYSDNIILKYSELIPYIIKTLEYCTKNKIKFDIGGIPICFIQKYKKNCNDLINKKNVNFEDIFIKHNISYKFNEHSRIKHRKQIKECENCHENYCCPGPFEYYINKFGTKEFIAIRKMKKNKINKINQSINKNYELHLGYSCNNNCTCCPSKNLISEMKLQNKKIDLSTTEIISEITKIKNENYNTILFTGGEPTIRADFFNIINYSIKIGFKKIIIQSNARFLSYEQNILKINKPNNILFSTSIYHIDPKIHDEITNVTGSCEQTKKGIHNLIKNKMNVDIKIILSKQNYKDIIKIVNEFTYGGKISVEIVFPNPKGNALDNFELFFLKYTDIMTEIPKIHKYLINKVNLSFTNIPPCFMIGYEQACNYMDKIKIITKQCNDQKYDYNFITQNKFRSKSKKCIGCKHYELCDGPWIEYTKRKGWSEFNPVK